MPVKGGAKLAAHLRQQQQQAPQVSRGRRLASWAGSIPDDIPIAQVGAAHEFGLGVRSMRPWLRPAVFESLAKVRRLVRERSDPSNLAANRVIAEELGRLVRGYAIQARILFISQPAAGCFDAARTWSRDPAGRHPPTAGPHRVRGLIA